MWIIKDIFIFLMFPTIIFTFPQRSSGVNDCENHDGYRCVEANLCGGPGILDEVFQNTKTDIRIEDTSNQQDDKLQGLLINIFNPEDEKPETATCKITGDICCKEESISTTTEFTPSDKCEDYSKFGFKCAKETECLDEGFKNFGEHAFTPKQSIFDESIFGFDAKCTNQEEVCCKQTLEPPTEKNCEDDPEFHCVPSQNCHENVKGEKGLIEVKPITEGSLFDVRQIGGTRIELDNTKSTCKKDLNICCKKAPVTTPTTTTTTLSTSTTKTTTTTTVTTTVRAPPKCGKHHPDGLEIKAKHSSDGGEGQSTQHGEWPHACLILDTSTNKEGKFVGGASIISPGVILTAAHKVEHIKLPDIKVRCGDWDLTNNNELHFHQDRGVAHVSIHPLYTGNKTLEYNYALLHVDEDFILDLHISPICLPEIPDKKTDQYGEKGCFAMGWGASRFEDKLFQVQMRQVKLPIVRNPECQNFFRNTRLPDTFELHDTFICAGGIEGEDVCEGDGGGPLVCPRLDDSRRFTLAGIIAWSIGCGQKDVPGAYSDISKALCFIDFATKCQDDNKYQEYYDYSEKCNDFASKYSCNDIKSNF